MKPEQLEQLLHENECTYLDFKRAQYPFAGEIDDVKSELLKDILALANAESGRDGFILIGAQENRGGRAKILGVTSHLNDHDLQQFVNSKTQRPIQFSYEVVPCDGFLLGVILVPSQDGYFFLKNDFGKLSRNIVYYRLGSSTAEKSPDDLIRRGKEVATKDDQPRLELEFAQIKRPYLIGGSPVTQPLGTTAKVAIRYAKDLSDVEIAQLAPPPPRLAASENHEYFKEFAKFVKYAFMYAPLGLRLINTGGSTATGISVRLKAKPQHKVMIQSEGSYPVRPLHKYKIARGFEPMASHYRPSQKDLLVRSDDSETEITWNVPKVLPHLPVFSNGVFFVCALNSPLELEAAIYAENLRKPAQLMMTISVESVSKDFTVEEINELSEKFVRDDRDHGTGRIQLYAKGS